ncbi:MAG: hypothetical protein WBE26_20600 [Phycisphaerae bacterium]
MGVTIGGRGDRYAGYVHLGSGRSGPRAYGALYYDGGRRHHRQHHYYRDSHYYFGYRPIRYFGRRYYEPWYGYSYISAYRPTPHVYRFYDTDVYYIDQVYGAGGAYDAAGATGVEVLEGPPTPGEALPALTEPGDATLIGQGNTAFMVGRYDEAHRLYASAMLAEERDGYAKFLYSLANFAMKDYEVAAMAIRRALLTTPELIDYPVDVRRLYSHASAFETQMDDLRRFVRDHPGDRGSRLLLGYLHYAGGEPGRALPILSDLAVSDANDGAATLLHDAVVRIVREGEPD